MADAVPILEMRSITKEFPGVKALSDVSITVGAGEIHAICGENGAGKSTLMKVLSGVYPHGTYSGEIWFRGELVAFRDIRASEQAGIAIIHQELALIPELSITENLFLGNEIARGGVIDWSEARLRAVDLLARVGLREDPDTQIKHLGVGKQQLVEIAKAIAKDVKLIILDEPTAALNEDDSQHLLDLILSLKGKGITSIIISHKLNEIEQIADEITIIRDGRTIETLDLRAGGVDEDRIIRGMVGRSLESRFPDRTPHIGEVFFEVRDWTVQHPQVAERLVAKGSNLFVRRGEIVGLAGLMGAGRTELAMSIFGRSYGKYLSGTIIKDGRGRAEGRAGGDRARSRVRQRGPEGARTQSARHHQALDRRREARQDLPPRRRRPLRRERHRRGLPQTTAHQDAVGGCRGLEAFRRQPAEGRPREVDVHRSRPADPR